MRKLLYIIALFLIIGLQNASAQQKPLYSNYMLTPMVLNPAFAGYHDMASLSLNNRLQWIGMGVGNGAPTTASLNFHTTLPVDKMGAGINIVGDSYGVVKELHVDLAGSYKVQFGDDFLSVGLQGGFSRYAIDLRDVNTNGGSFLVKKDEGDASFPEVFIKETWPSFGFGVMYSSSNWFGGISVPKYQNQLVGSKQDDVELNPLGFKRHIYATGGLILDFMQQFKLKPSFLLTYNPDHSISLDLNASLLLSEKAWAGMTIRGSQGSILNAFIVMGQLQVNDLIKVGAAYDLPLQADLIGATGGTFELFLNSNFSVFGAQAVQTFYY